MTAARGCPPIDILSAVCKYHDCKKGRSSKGRARRVRHRPHFVPTSNPKRPALSLRASLLMTFNRPLPSKFNVTTTSKENLQGFVFQYSIAAVEKHVLQTQVFQNIGSRKPTSLTVGAPPTHAPLSHNQESTRMAWARHFRNLPTAATPRNI